MGIDWITVSAQIINFLVLVWLLKRFLYQPVLQAMQRREKRISDRLQAAQDREKQAEKQRKEFHDKARKFELQREKLLQAVARQGEADKLKMLDQAREQVAKTREDWQQQANREKQDFLNKLRSQSVTAIESIARKTLADLANTRLEEQIILRFIEQLKTLDQKALQALGHTSEPVQITSSHELDAELRDQVTGAVHNYIAKDIDINFVISPKLLSGIELSAGGQRLSWNLASYTDQIADRVSHAFDQGQPALEKDEER